MACGFESRSWIFQNVMDALGVIVKNMPAGKEGHLVTACSKDKMGTAISNREGNTLII